MVSLIDCCAGIVLVFPSAHAVITTRCALTSMPTIATFLAEMAAISGFFVIRPEFRLLLFQQRGRFVQTSEANRNVLIQTSQDCAWHRMGADEVKDSTLRHYDNRSDLHLTGVNYTVSPVTTR